MSHPNESFLTAYIDFLMGYAHWKNGDNGPAAELMKRGTTGMEAQLGWGHPTYIAAMTAYEAFLRQTRRNAEAAEVQTKITSIQTLHKKPELAGTETAPGMIAQHEDYQLK
jgi:hypothetical protein